MNKRHIMPPCLLLTLVLLWPTVSSAGDSHRHHGPPPEAIEACEGKDVGESVVLTDPRGESVQATCCEMDGELVAVPDNMRRKERNHHGPPPEAMEACEGQNSGASVVLDGPHGESVEATCQVVDGQLVAVPDDMRMGGDRR